MLKSLSTSLILRGLLALGIGIVALAWPGVTVLALVVLFAVYAFMGAGLEAVQAFSSRTAGPVAGHLLLGLSTSSPGWSRWPGRGPPRSSWCCSWPAGRSSPAVRDLRRLRCRRDRRDPGTVHPGGPGVRGVRRRAVRPPRHGRDHACAAVRPVQPDLRQPGRSCGASSCAGPARPCSPPWRNGPWPEASKVAGLSHITTAGAGVESVLKAPPMTSADPRAGPGPGYPERLPLWVPRRKEEAGRATKMRMPAPVQSIL